MDKGVRFEIIVAEYHKRRGYKAELTPHSHDYGADIILFSNQKKIVVQTKYLFDGKVSIGAVQEISGAIKHFNADEGWVITNATFTKNAIELANSNKILLIENFSDDKKPTSENRFSHSYNNNIPHKIPYKIILILAILLFGFIFVLFLLLPYVLVHTGNINPLTQTADTSYASKQYGEANFLYGLALFIEPNNYLIWQNKAESLRKLGRYEEAIICYDNAIKINSTHAFAWEGKAVSLIFLNRSKEEICQTFERAYVLAPNDPVFKINQSEIIKYCNF